MTETFLIAIKWVMIVGASICIGVVAAAFIGLFLEK